MIVEKFRSIKRENVIRLLICLNVVVLIAFAMLLLVSGIASGLGNDANKDVLDNGTNSAQINSAALPPPDSTVTAPDTIEGKHTYDISQGNGLRIGVDVSEHQGQIDWQQVKASGISFAFIRVGARGYTQGDIIPDAYFASNLNGAKEAGLQVGVYFFSQAVTEAEAREEADFVLQQLNGAVLDYPITFDMESVTDSEGRINGLSAGQRTRNAVAFCNQIEAAGYTAMLYGNANDLSYYAPSLFDRYDIWFAEYDVYSPNTSVDMTIWQFASTGVIPGISTFVDFNIHFEPGAERRLPDSIVIHEAQPDETG